MILDNNTDNQITVGNADKVFEQGTVITVESVTQGEIYNTVKEALKDVVADMTHTAILDITATLNGKPVQPSGKVQMTFAIPENLSVDNLKLFYVSDDGKTTEEIAITENYKRTPQTEKSAWGVFAWGRESNPIDRWDTMC